MGTIAQAYESGGQTALEGLFSNLVTLMRVDGKVDEAEVAMLEKVARKLSLTEEMAKEIISHPEDFPMVPPTAKEERHERLISFIKMAFADGVVDASEEKLIAKFTVALGYNEADAQKNTAVILEAVQAGKDSNDILASLS